jgi:hypothetical protein
MTLSIIPNDTSHFIILPRDLEEEESLSRNELTSYDTENESLVSSNEITTCDKDGQLTMHENSNECQNCNDQLLESDLFVKDLFPRDEDVMNRSDLEIEDDNTVSIPIKQRRQQKRLQGECSSIIFIFLSQAIRDERLLKVILAADRECILREKNYLLSDAASPPSQSPSWAEITKSRINHCMLNVNSESSSCQVLILRLHYEVCFGQSLSVVGGIEMLGQWDPRKALPMEWGPGNVWSIELVIPPGKKKTFCSLHRK